MQLYSTEGIIFRTLKYSETSIICDIFTETHGLRSYIVSGVRSSRKGNNAAIYQPGNIVHLISYQVDQDKLARIKEIHLSHHYENIISDIVISSMIIFLVEVCRNAIKERESNPDLYLFIRRSFIQIDDRTLQPNTALLTRLIELSKILGFEPMNNFSDENCYFDLMEGSFNDGLKSPYLLDAPESKAFEMFIRQDESIGVTSRTMRNQLLRKILTYFKLHLPDFKDIKSLDVLTTILS